MLLQLISAVVLTASPAAPEASLSRWLVRCDPPGAAASATPSLDPAAVEAALAGTGAVPEGWTVQTLPAALQASRCWFAHRLPPSEEAVGLWLSRTRVAWTVYVDGAQIWTRGSESGRYATTESGYPGFIVPPQLLGSADSRLVLMRGFNKFRGVQIPPVLLLNPSDFADQDYGESAVASNLTSSVSVLFGVFALVALTLAAVRRSAEVLYFGLGATGYAYLFFALSFEWVPFDQSFGIRLVGASLSLALPFFALFFQRLYERRVRRGLELVAAAQVVVTFVLGVGLADRHVNTVPMIATLLGTGWLAYSLYLNARARRAGDEIARSVLWGFAVMAAFVVLDMVRFALQRDLQSPLVQVGVLFFVSAILIALARRFFRVSAESARMLQRLKETASGLGGLVVNLQGAATQLSGAATEQVTALTQTASTTTEMNQTSAVSAARCLELIGQGEAAATVVQEGKKAAGTSRSAIEAISGALASVAGASHELSEKVQRIDRIIDTVSFLADQSAALAINASIEASRAGEAGQGFAAVAREVRSLANDSRRATSEIRDVLAEIRSRTHQMEEQVSQGSETIHGGVAHISRLAEVVASLGGTIDSAVGLMRQVESSARQHQSGVEQVLGAVTSIHRASESIRDGAETLSSLSRQANEMSSALVASTAPTRHAQVN